MQMIFGLHSLWSESKVCLLQLEAFRKQKAQEKKAKQSLGEAPQQTAAAASDTYSASNTDARSRIAEPLQPATAQSAGGGPIPFGTQSTREQVAGGGDLQNGPKAASSASAKAGTTTAVPVVPAVSPVRTEYKPKQLPPLPAFQRPPGLPSAGRTFPLPPTLRPPVAAAVGFQPEEVSGADVCRTTTNITHVCGEKCACPCISTAACCREKSPHEWTNLRSCKQAW